MTDLEVTAANVAKGANAQTKVGTAGVTITAGQAVYIDASDNNEVKLADCDASEATAHVRGIALNGGAAGQPIVYQTQGRINPGATVTVGEIYVASGTAGGIAPEGDLASGDWVTVIGIGVSASLIELGIHVSGVQVPA